MFSDSSVSAQDRILVVDHVSAGCGNNVRAVAMALSRQLNDAPTDIIQCRLRSKFLIPLLKILLRRSPDMCRNRLRRLWWPIFFKGAFPPCAQYRFVVSTLGPGESVGATIAYFWRATLIHIGTPRRMPKRLFHAVIANPGITPKKGEMHFIIPPSRIAFADLAHEAARVHAVVPPHQYAALLVGGCADEVYFDQAYWNGVYAYMQAHTQRSGQKWLVTTSPRTPKDVVARLTALAQDTQGFIAHLAVFDAQQPSWLPAYIGAASSIYVTADSVSMLADAMATDKPVTALSDIDAIKNPRIVDFLTEQLDAQHMRLVNVSQSVTDDAAEPITRPLWSETFLQDLAARHIDVSPITAQKADNHVRILGIGDCNTGGVNEAPTDNLPNMLASVLRAQGKHVDVINLGKAMTTTREGIAFARDNAQAADIVLINFGLLDSWWAVLPGWYVPYYPDNALRKIGRKLLKSLKKRLRKPFVRRFLPMGYVIPLEEYRANLVRIIEYVRRYSPHATVVLWGLAPARLSDERDRELIVFDRIVREVAQANDAVYIDTRTLFAPHSYEYLYRDHVHIGAKGQRIIADALCAHIHHKNEVETDRLSHVG